MLSMADIYEDVITSLHSRWTPHRGQTIVGQKLFRHDIKNIFIRCGRKWGKTELVSYVLWRWAQSNAGATCYYIAPFLKQAKEIIWANRRLQTFGPREWLLDGKSGMNDSELRLKFKNGSFIKLDGSENFDAYRGVEPHIIVYEEFKDFRPEFHDAMDPNRAPFDAPLVIVGSPPEGRCQYSDLEDDWKSDPNSFTYHAPTRQNPHISPDWLRRKRGELIRRGDEDIWLREYEALYTKGGKRKILPMLNSTLVVKHDLLMRKIGRDRNKIQWICAADPGTTTCFAVLFVLVNPFSKKIMVVDEIYETVQAKTTSRAIWHQTRYKKGQLWGRADWEDAEWIEVYDEAASWFVNELDGAELEHQFVPTRKVENKKENGLGLIREATNLGLVEVSDRCVNFISEAENYILDRNGKIPKENDHLLDCFRYALHAVNYSVNEAIIEQAEWPDERRGVRLEDDDLDDDGIKFDNIFTE